jgi:hypothetical protein
MANAGKIPKRSRPRGREYKSTQMKGVQTESRVVNLLSQDKRPWWIMSVRRGSSIEDDDGIDLVVRTTDHGDLYLQVKSSDAGAEKWEESLYRRKHTIGLIIAREVDEDDVVYGHALGVLIGMRVALEMANDDLSTAAE